MPTTTTSEIVHDPVFGYRLQFSHVTGHDGATETKVEMWLDPGCAVPAHVHPSIEERFEVLEGQAQFLSGRKWLTGDPGESFTIPAGTRHAFRNRSDAEAHVMATATPGSQSLEDFLTEAAEISRAGGITKLGIPKPRGILPGIALVQRHREMVTMGFPMPPAPVQRLLFPPLARLAERRRAATA
jgi:quercetin dioxygenase-like cupin family protein